ncbi:hypothetical protein V6N11_041187 [Hibiscus sabdariffa]|uniref:Uncharacterized protein n=1 Tax=Hibiscus sabdariffa TaxID=183260 RepID=A0ABR2RJP4_9ROSI
MVFLTPYHKTRYHPSEFRGANSRGPREVFKRAHSSLRSCIERALSKVHDPAFNVIDKDPNFVPPEAISYVAPMQEEAQQLGTNEMTKVRNDITTSLMIARQRHDS